MHYTVVTALFLAVFLGNRYALESPWLGAVLLLFFFLFYGRHLHARFGSLLLLSTILTIGTIVYYIAFLPDILWTIIVVLTPVGVWLAEPEHCSAWRVHVPSFPSVPRQKGASALLIIAALLLLGIAKLVTDVEIFDAVRSPWERLPTALPWLFFLLTVTLGALAFSRRGTGTPPIAIALFLAIAIAAIVYPLGFGFDSFLHQATERHIAEFGTIDPKPFYYIGQYVSVLFASEAFRLPLLLVDRFLLPVLTAFFLPLAFFSAIEPFAKSRRSALFAVFAVFLLPLSTFIVTTPQGLANLFTLLLLLLSLGRGVLAPPISLRETPPVSLRALWLIAIAAAAIHPLAGIPALLYVVLLTLRGGEEAFWEARPRPATNFESLRFKISSVVAQRALFLSVIILGSVSLPIVFLVNAAVSGLDLHFSLAGLAPTALLESLHVDLLFQSGFNTFLDFAYLLKANLLLLFILCAGYFLWKPSALPQGWKLPALMAGILAVNYVILQSAIDFTFLIDYERTNYSSRLITLIFFFLVPYVLLFLERVGAAIEEREPLAKAFVLLLLGAVVTSQIYLAYPRRDNYETSRGFNTGAADVLAVEHIANDAPEDFIVLANQQVSAAAVSEFGFRKYYGDVFYYPIPTGGELYQFFLRMNERPERATVEQAMDLAGVRTAYYVVNDYWWQSERLIETAKTNADNWIALSAESGSLPVRQAGASGGDNGRVHVFRYDQ